MFLRVAALLFLFAFSALAAPGGERLSARYKQLLIANPAEGIPLDRLWELHQKNGTTVELLKEFRAARETFAGAMIHGLLLQKAGQINEARAEFAHAARIDPKTPAPHLALAAALAGQPKAAAVELEKAAALLPAADPKLSDVLLKLGNAWLSANEPAKATEAWERIIALHSDDLKLRRRLAENYEKNGLAEKASAHFEYISAHGDPAERAQAFQEIARLRQARGETDRAIAAIESGLALTAPGNWLRAELQSQLIRIHQRYGRTAELEQRWKNAIAENPRDLAAYSQLVELYERTGDLEGQREWLEKIVALAPKNRESRLKLAHVASQLNDVNRAIAVTDELLKEQPRDADLVFFRAELDLQRDAVQPAKARIEALLVMPECPETVRTKGIEFYKKHRLFDVLEKSLRAQNGDEAAAALADFYFGQRRPADAARALEQIVRPADSEEKQAEALARIARILRDQQISGAALNAVQRAVALRPRDAELQLLLAELFAAENRISEARAALETARGLGSDPASRAAVDQKLFRLFQARAVPDARDAAQPVELATFMADLTRNANENPTAENLLRAARWKFWTGEFKESLAFAQKAIGAEPGNIDAREIAAKAATSANLRPVALVQLYELARLDPRLARTREVGRAELQLGHVGAALRIFGGLVADHPGDPSALSDLALAQQQSENLAAALETWQRAYAASPPARKKEILQPLLRVMERLGKAEAGASLVLRSIEEASDESVRAALLQDLIAMAARDRLLPFVITELEARHRMRPDDAFTSRALAQVLKAGGRAEEALVLLNDATYADSDDAASLPELVREAESLGRFDEAIQHQQRLVAGERVPDGAALQKLAELQETNLDIGSARKTWERILRNFPREPAMLRAAADFFQRWNLDDLARENLRKIRVVEPGDLKTLATLARLSMASGDAGEALSCYEQLLDKSDAETPEDVMVFPSTPLPKTAFPAAFASRRGGGPRVEVSRALRGLFEEETGPLQSNRELRLAAIRGTSEILREQGGAPLAAWLTRWRKSETRSESVWAFYFAGEAAETLRRISELTQRVPGDPEPGEAFVWIALQMRQYAKLGEWVFDPARSPAGREAFLAGLAQFVRQNNALEPRMVAELFPEKRKLHDLLWKAALIFASGNHLREAIPLGERVLPDAVTQRAAIALELAHWNMMAGATDKAREHLRLALAEPGDGFEQPPYAALREYFRLLDPGEREKFSREFPASLDRERRPVHADIALVVLHGLRGDHQSAGAEMTRLLALRPAPGRTGDEPEDASAYRFWAFVLAGGTQFQEWKRDDLAAMWWERALADPAAIKLDGESAAGIAREVRLRMFARRLARCGEDETEALVDEISRKLGRESLSVLASLLENGGVPGRAVALYRNLWHRDLQNQQFLRGILSASWAAGDVDAVEEALREGIATGNAGPNPAMYRESLFHLLDLLEARGSDAETQRVIEQAMIVLKTDPTLLERLAGVHERRGNIGEAEKLRRRLCTLDQGNPVNGIALARLLDKSGRTSEAIEFLEAAKNPAAASANDAALFDIYVKNKQPAKASLAFGRLARGGNFRALPARALELAKAGERKTAERVLHMASMQCKDAHQRFALELNLAGLLREDPENGVLRGAVLKRLYNTAAEAGDLLPGYFEALSRQSDGEAQLRNAWRDGAGPLAAGGQLLRIAFESQDNAAARRLAEQLAAHPAANEQTFEALRRRAADAGQLQLALLFAEARCRSGVADPEAFRNWAAALQANGDKAGALKVLRDLELRAAMNDGAVPVLARAYSDLGEPALAKRYFAEALRSDPLARNYDAWLRAARVLLADGNTDQARHLLRVAFRNQANREFGELVNFYAATVGIERLPEQVTEFQIKGERLRNLWVEVISHYCRKQEIGKAVAFASEHPDVVASKSEARAQLRALAKDSGRFAECVSLFERVLAQSPGDAPEIAPDLAQLLADFAEHDLASADGDSALKHLLRAHDLAPGMFQIVERLGGLLASRGDAFAAQKVLNQFVADCRDPAEREKARELLLRLPK